MADSDLAALVTAKSEALEVEYKSWSDTSVAETSAKLARHLAALSNHGGGYLIFGCVSRADRSDILARCRR
jgi:predicted HTH transcriptional regulator